jgi:TatA/E family protein of Tat protein translocase
MGSLGMQEIMIIFILALIVFGPRKLPEIGKTIGKGLAEFKRASNELKQTWEDEVNLDKEKESLSEIVKDVTLNPTEILNDVSKSMESEPEKLAANLDKEKESLSEIAQDNTVNPAESLDDINKSIEFEPKKLDE